MSAPSAQQHFGTLEIDHASRDRVRELADAALNAEGHFALAVLDGMSGPLREEAMAHHRAIRQSLLALAALRGVTP